MPSENPSDLEIALPANPLLYGPPLFLAAYSRVYATAFVKNDGWSIHLAGPHGEHMRLAAIPDFPAVSLRNDRIRALRTEIARGLHIADGGGA